MVKYTPDAHELARRRRQSQKDKQRHGNRSWIWSCRTQATRINSSIATHTIYDSIAEPPHLGLEAGSAYQSTIITSPQASQEDSIPVMAGDIPMKDNKLSALFNNQKHSDVTIIIGRKSFELPAHSAILAVASPFFDNALSSEFQEGKSRRFHYVDDSPHAVWRVFEYMYTSDYSEEAAHELKDEGDDLELLKHPRVYALADRFRMDDLQALAVRYLETQLKDHWISDTITDCIREVYGNTVSQDDVMRGVVAEMAASKIQNLRNRAAFLEVVRDVGDFAVDLIKLLGESNGRRKSYGEN